MVKLLKLSAVGALSLLLTVGCSADTEKQSEESKIHTVAEKDKEEVDESNEENSLLELFNELAESSEDSEEIYVTDILNVSADSEVKPGIYDLEVTGGSGNIFGERENYDMPYINWVAASKENDTDYPSKIRIILLEGDELEFSDISKIKFHSIPKEVEPSNELGIGEFIVGRDILPGDYKLSTEVKLDPELDNLGWDIDINNLENSKYRQQTLTAANNDVMVTLKEGEIVSISYDNTDYGSSADDARLIFEEQ